MVDSTGMRILALGAHPDDIEAGCGGTLIKYARGGHRIFLMVLLLCLGATGESQR